ncbi:hypothetical protein JCM10049v2_006667 [Rhodotorula toruloides]
MARGKKAGSHSNPSTSSSCGRPTPSPPPRDEREAISDIAERLAYVENNTLDITALVALLFRLCDHYAERVNTYPSEWERFLVAVLQTSFRQGLLGTSGVLENEDMRDEASEKPDPWFPPYEMRQKEVRWEAQAKAYFEGDGSLIRQREGETFVECMERAAQLALERDKEFPTDSKKGTVHVEPLFLAGADWAQQYKQHGFARGVQFAPVRPELIVLHSGKDGKVNWSAAKFIWTLTGYEGQGMVPLYGLVHAGFCRKLIERQLAKHPLLRPTDYIMVWIRDDGWNEKPAVGAHEWTQEVEDSVCNLLFDKLPRWLDVPSQEECDWRDQALRDDPDVRAAAFS